MPFLGLGVQLGHTLPPSGGGGGEFSNTYSLSLDGTDDYVNLGNSSDLAPSSITISAWIKVTGSVDTFNYIVSRAGSTYGSYHLRYTNANQFNMFLGFAGNAFKADITSSSTYTLTDWHHVAFTYDQTNAKLYVDGVEEYSGAETRAIDYTASPYGSNTHIGSTPMPYPSPSEGLIDEVALFNSALSASDVASLRDTSGSNPVPADISSLNPVGWWRMGDTGSDYGTSTITNAATGSNSGGSAINGAIENGASGNTTPTFSTNVPS